MSGSYPLGVTDSQPEFPHQPHLPCISPDLSGFFNIKLGVTYVLTKRSYRRYAYSFRMGNAEPLDEDENEGAIRTMDTMQYDGKALPQQSAASRHSIPPLLFTHCHTTRCSCCTRADDSCPPVMFLGVHNSMTLEADTACKVALYSPYWVDNRAGVDLVFKDVDVPKLFADVPFLGGWVGETCPS